VLRSMLGAWWFSPAGLLTPFHAAANRDKRDPNWYDAVKANMGFNLFVGFIFNVIQAVVLSHQLGLAGATTAVDALQVAAWLFVGLIAPACISDAIWLGKPALVMAITMGQHAAAAALMSVVIVLTKTL